MASIDSLHVEMTIPARPDRAPVVRGVLRRFLYDIPMAGERVSDVLLAVGEATSNAIEHAYAGEEGPVFVRAAASCSRKYLEIEVSDRGRWRVSTSEERGRGLMIMRALIENVAVRSGKHGTSIRFEMRI